MTKRIVFDVVILLSIFLTPWWVTLPLFIFGLFVFDNFYEFIIYGIIMYSMYSPDGGRIISSEIFYPIIILGFYFFVDLLKNYIILYKK